MGSSFRASLQIDQKQQNLTTPLLGDPRQRRWSRNDERDELSHPLRPRTTNRHHLASSRQRQSRIPKLFLLPRGTRMQDQFRRHAVVDFATLDVAVARSNSGDHRRHAHPTVRPEGRRGRQAVQIVQGGGRGNCYLCRPRGASRNRHGRLHAYPLGHFFFIILHAVKAQEPRTAPKTSEVTGYPVQ